MNILFYSKLKKKEYFIVPDLANYTLIPKDVSSDYHIHPVYHIMFVISGAGYLENDGGKHLMKPKDIIIINPNEKHILSSDNEKGMTYYSFNFYLLSSGNYETFIENNEWEFGQRMGQWVELTCINAETSQIDEIFSLSMSGNYIKYDKSQWGKITLLIANFSGTMEEYYINLINQWKTSPSWNRQMCLDNFARFFADIYRILSLSMGKHELEKSDDKLLDSIIDYLKENVHDRYCLPSLAAYLNYNPTYLCTYFKENTGMTINQYFNKLKIHKACMYLKTTDKSITEIAYLLNYSSPNHFSRNFKQEKNMSPRDYRRRIEI